MNYYCEMDTLLAYSILTTCMLQQDKCTNLELFSLVSSSCVLRLLHCLQCLWSGFHCQNLHSTTQPFVDSIQFSLGRCIAIVSSPPWPFLLWIMFQWVRDCESTAGYILPETDETQETSTCLIKHIHFQLPNHICQILVESAMLLSRTS